MAYLWPTLFAVGIWWFSTVLLMWRLRLPAQHIWRTLFVAWCVLGAGIVLAGMSLDRPTALGACMAFAAALAVWGWHETVYLLGLLTGPRPSACPAGATTFERFRFGVAASLYHELAVLLTVIGVWWWSAGAANTVAAEAFTVLWLLRWSTKINIFFGVHNLHTEFWPERLRYLETYVGNRPNALAAAGSVLLFAALALWVLGSGDAVALPGSLTAGFEPARHALLLTLLALGVAEHVFLAVRLNDEWLWSLAGNGEPAPQRLSVRATLLRDGKLPRIDGRGK